VGRSAEKGKIGATQFLLENGAKLDVASENRLTPLMKAVERDHVGIVSLLIKHDANLETVDKKGRTALMTAAWKNQWGVLNILIAKGANVNAKDHKGRNVLHNLAADKQCNWGEDVIQLLLKQNISIDGAEGQDKLLRSPLHWACATGKKQLVEMLLMRNREPRANIGAVEIREKTPLHLAAAHDRDSVVEILLQLGAKVDARSDGGWTPIHIACEIGSERVVRLLLAAGADVNARLLNGTTSLHLAAQGGHLQVVNCLLGCKGIKRAVRDTFGSTPFLRAAQNKRKDIATLLASFNHVESLSEDALGACNGFTATIVDFGNFHNGNRVQKKTVYGKLNIPSN
jgi:ankyrin repeat protein